MYVYVCWCGLNISIRQSQNMWSVTPSKIFQEQKIYWRIYVCVASSNDVFLSVWLFVCISVLLFVCLTFHLFACLFVFFVCLPVCLLVCLSVCLFVCLSVCPFIFLVGRIVYTQWRDHFCWCNSSSFRCFFKPISTNFVLIKTKWWSTTYTDKKYRVYMP